MSNTDSLSKKKAPLAVPAESDENFIRYLEYDDPIRKASVWLHKLIVHRIRDIQRLAPWYRGEVAAPQHNEEEKGTTRYGQLVSDLFSQDDGRFCSRFNYYCRIIKKYRQGEVPRMVIDIDLRVAEIMIANLVGLAGESETLRLFRRRIREFVQLVNANDGSRQLRNDYLAKLDLLADNILTVSGRISDEFRRIEQELRGERSKPATQADVDMVRKTAAQTDLKVDAVKTTVIEEAKSTRRTVRKVAKAAVKEVRRKEQSDYEKRGPTSRERSAQYKVVIDQLTEYAKDRWRLPAPLRDKNPAKWIRQACADTWKKTKGGYPTFLSLYGYCHRNEERTLSLAGL